jgi:uncharacterized ParB-like nuclease family protein
MKLSGQNFVQRKNKPVQIIPVNVMTKRIFYAFNRSHGGRAYSKQTK